MLLHLRPGSKILDVGCGGGRPVLAAIGPTVGLEPIAELAVQARTVYAEVVECGAEAMRLNDGQFDAVVSTDILGHIPVPIKDAVMSEMFRVLRPGGITLHLAEADSNGWLARIAKRESAPYQHVWIDVPDHRAMETAEVQLARFRKAGFVIEKSRPFLPVVVPCGAISVLLKEHKNLPLWLKMFRYCDGILAKNEIICEIANVVLTPLSVINLFAPVGHGLGILIKARKPHHGEVDLKLRAD